MKRYSPFLILFTILFSCRTQPNSDRQYADGDPNKVYKLRLDPPAGAKYDYDISKESEFKLEVNDKKVDNLNKADVGLDYTIDKDSAGNFILHMKYTKIKIHTRNGEIESDMDAANAATSLDATERMLGFIKGATITAVLSPVGETRSITGLKEIMGHFMEQFNIVDANTRQAMQQKWDDLLSGNLMVGNTEQLFHIFPDSAAHIGDRWHLASRQKGELALNGKNSYELTAIRDGVTFITMEGDISSDSSMVNMMGYQVTPNLKGHQHGDFQMESKTGMVVNARITSSVEGTIQMLGRDIPITIESSIKMELK